jgi:hypothetical protein|tara:strand:+ start:308 stop:634 length:327 start_codon:yes stop_codon:yes gene_type:complete
MFLLIALILINLAILMKVKCEIPGKIGKLGKSPQPAKAKAKANASTDGEWTIYGSMGCGWTRKQLDYMKSAGKPFTFVDCDSEECAGVEGFPTMTSPDGERVVGFKEV